MSQINAITRQAGLGRKVSSFFLSGTCCELAFLGCAYLMLRAQDLPLDYERWGGYLLLSIIVIPQAFVVGYTIAVVIQSFMRTRRLFDPRVSAVIGTLLGVGFYLLEGNIKWVVPWMLLMTHG